MFVNDNGTLRRVRQMYVNDSGTLRRVRQIYLNDNGTLRREALSAPILTATLVEGSHDEGGGPFIFGYSQGFSTPGSLTPDTDTDGHQVVYLASSSGVTTLIISGFGADPGQSYFSTVAVDAALLNSGAATYSYSSGNAQWDWGSEPFGFDGSGSRAVVITR